MLISNLIQQIQIDSAWMLPCMYKKYLGLECPGCGFQRALILLFKGEFMASLKMYPPLIPILSMIAMLCYHLKFKPSNGASLLKYMFIFNSIIVLINFIIKLTYIH